MMFCAAAGPSLFDRNSGDRFKKVSYEAPESDWPLAGSVIKCLEPLLNCQCSFKF